MNKLGGKVAAMLLAQAILAQTIQTARFYRCACGNDQPYVEGRGRPDCESCGRKPPKEAKK